ncbi:Lon protease C-terminal proteolytic domain-containing protein [Tribonema minus]|uniref:endopeptidase La n=1 Tax=Tribonema minus TaxID=303371 RepID=A0A835ZDR9_9STRA|nr:Lon protease C-terminal proteolytic domain-containing protein [Tribonema minus]
MDASGDQKGATQLDEGSVEDPQVQALAMNLAEAAAGLLAALQTRGGVSAAAASPELRSLSRAATASAATAPGAMADAIVSSLASVSAQQKQAVLEAADLVTRLTKALEVVNEQTQIVALSSKLKSSVDERLMSQQREYYLRQQLKAIREELGEEGDGAGGGGAGADDAAEVTELTARLEKARLPPAARAAADKELRRLRRMPPTQPERGVVATYLELMADLPWSALSPERVADLQAWRRRWRRLYRDAQAQGVRFSTRGGAGYPRLSVSDKYWEMVSLSLAREQLDADHHGLEPVKRRLIEYMAVRLLRGKDQESRGSILCLVGPPGVGKTSLGRSVAVALGRKFQRLSLGGVHDEASIRGHRRTYIGALPGLILQSLKRAQTRNPVLLLDEVDKMGKWGTGGDPAAALLEVLDPEQNATFVDSYLGLPFDLSRVLFVATANATDTIPEALLDRMEVLEVPGYTLEEKLKIAREHLLPKQMHECGVTAEHMEVMPAALSEAVSRYTREAGVRQLERQLGALCRHVALKASAAQGVKDRRGSAAPHDAGLSGAARCKSAAAAAAALQCCMRGLVAAELAPAGPSTAPVQRLSVALSADHAAHDDADGAAEPGAADFAAADPSLLEQLQGAAASAGGDATSAQQQGGVGLSVGPPESADDVAVAVADAAPPAAAAAVAAAAETETAALPFERVVVDVEALHAILGRPRHEREGAADFLAPGVCTGLAWTRAGGELLFVECSGVAGGGGGALTLTGQLGEVSAGLPQLLPLLLLLREGGVMKESATLALSWIRSNEASICTSLGLPPPRQAFVLDPFSTDIHIHVPAGATPKDGPSAGIAIASSLLSLLIGRSIDPTVGVTGEVTLRGLVLPVGGVKDKVLAAHRGGLRHVILPQRNRRDLEDLPADVRDALRFSCVSTLLEAFQVLFTSADAAAAAVAPPQQQQRRPESAPTAMAASATAAQTEAAINAYVLQCISTRAGLQQAARFLQPKTVAIPDDDCFAAMQSKHPPAAPGEQLHELSGMVDQLVAKAADMPAELSLLQGEGIEPETVAKLIQRASPHSGAGPSGLRYSHLQDALRTSWGRHEFAAVLTRWLQAVMREAARLPDAFWQLHGAGRLTLLAEQQEDGTAKQRPIVCGEVLQRLCTSVYVADRKDFLAELLEPDGQYGVAVSAGAEKAAMAGKLAYELGHWQFMLDLKNAFNMVFVLAAAEWVAAQLPDFLDYFIGTYVRTRPRLLFQHVDGSTRIIMSQARV